MSKLSRLEYLLDRHKGLIISAILIVVMAALWVPNGVNASEAAKVENILLITVDTLRADWLSCYGCRHLQTPWIDKLAQKGTLFTRAFAHTPTTLPSHANILIGSTPLSHGVHENAAFVVEQKWLTLAEFLKEHGFATAAFVGAFPLDSRFGLDQGFDVYDDEYESKISRKFSYGERKAGVVVNRALAWLEGRTPPWFLWVHVFDPHEPYFPPSPFDKEYKDRPYDGEVAYVDQELGRLIDNFEKCGLFENTLIILTADHGESLGQHGEETHGFLAYNTTLWVPLIIVQPGKRANKFDGYVAHIDIFPTVCEVFKLKSPSSLEGISLIAGMDSGRIPERTIYFESLYPFFQRNWAPIRGYIQGEKKFIDSPIPELYNLKSDFLEKENLVDQKSLGGYRQKLNKIISSGVPLGSESSRWVADRETLKKLSSLGYISGVPGKLKQSFEQSDDVKILLPFYNSVIKAINLHYDGQSKAAANMIKEVITERPDIDIAFSKLASIYKDSGRLGDAVTVLRQGMKVNPSSYEVLSAYVNALVDARLYREAIEVVSESQHRMMEYDPEIWNYVGIAYMQTGNFIEAKALFERALKIDAEYSSVHLNLGNNFLMMFLRNNDKEALSKSIGHLEKAIDCDPRSAMAYNSLGAALKKSDRLKDAVAAWEKALELDPELNMAIYNLGISYFEMGKKNQASVYLQRYLESYGLYISPEEKKKVEDLIAECRK